MTIQLNAGKNLNIHESIGSKFNDLLSAELSRYSEHITRLEVHFLDENGGKDGPNDKRCMIEARQESRQPTVVTEVANSYELATTGALLIN